MERLGRYILVEPIAKGGMAEVHLAAATGVAGFVRPLAIKTILPQAAADGGMIDMLVDEARITSALHHPNIVQVMDLGQDAGRFFMVMEYVSGRHLGNVLGMAIRQGLELPRAMALYVAREAFLGLDHAHTRLDGQGAPLGIVHRDISPQNILVGFDGTVRLSDFGIARAQGRKTHTEVGVVKGKAGYMSPEQARGEVVTPQTDIYAMGVVLWELLARRRMYSAKESVVSVAVKVATGQRPTLEQVGVRVDPWLQELVELALHPVASQRLPSAARGAQECARLLADVAPGFGAPEAAAWMKQVCGQQLLDEEARRMAELHTFAAGVSQAVPSASHAFPVVFDDVSTVRMPQRSVSVVVPKVDPASIRPAMPAMPAAPAVAVSTIAVLAPMPESEEARLARAIVIPDPPSEPIPAVARAGGRRVAWLLGVGAAAAAMAAWVSLPAPRTESTAEAKPRAAPTAKPVLPHAPPMPVVTMPEGVVRVAKADATRTGIIRLTALGPALVFVDGTPTDHNTPVALLLEEGTHELLLMDVRRGVNHQERVTVAHGDDRVVQVPF